ncbi:DUF3299 domain-containing protein [Pseudocolwellia sp. AS88]|uniref:DUF3299 domain-containing protein n=1 Tax=Pseudocolwellia sp. AS88 TaxID=3063958 RepID=UPI0026EC669D|nr:DUF3299 domain-containing protein [Pseudocolwellia sp. AS88]MDO7083648.1 DUF3299 domain-containing protein [Pseudocolwellia sp. AS88]
MKFFLILFLFLLAACEKPSLKSELTVSPENPDPISTKQDSTPAQVQNPAEKQTFDEIYWEELIPQDDLDAILNPPDYIAQVEDGSAEDQLENTIQSAINPDKSTNEVYEKALVSTRIIEAMDGRNIRIPGFIVPIEFIGEKKVASFFLVPYFGACLHLPPPPPNQIIYVVSEEGITLESLYEPVWISGKLSTQLFEDETATSAYTLTLAEMSIYQDGDSNYE